MLESRVESSNMTVLTPALVRAVIFFQSVHVAHRE